MVWFDFLILNSRKESDTQREQTIQLLPFVSITFRACHFTLGYRLSVNIPPRCAYFQFHLPRQLRDRTFTLRAVSLDPHTLRTLRRTGQNSTLETTSKSGPQWPAHMNSTGPGLHDSHAGASDGCESREIPAGPTSSGGRVGAD